MPPTRRTPLTKVTTLATPLVPLWRRGGARRLLLFLQQPLSLRLASAAPTTGRRLPLGRLLLWQLRLLLLLLHQAIDHCLLHGGAMRPMEQVPGSGGGQLLGGSR